MPVFNSPISPFTPIYSGSRGFLGMAQAPRPVLRTPEQVHDFLAGFATVEVWEVDDGYEKVLRFFLSRFAPNMLGPVAHILRDINATGFKVCLFPAGLLPLHGLAEALCAIVENPKSKRVFAQREIDTKIARVRASRHPPHAVRAYARAMTALAEHGVPRDHDLRAVDLACTAMLDGMENARHGRRLPRPEDQARVLHLALNVVPTYLTKFVQLCADEFARG